MAKAHKPARKEREVGSDRDAGKFMGIRIVDPVVKPKGATVREIRAAVEKVRSKHR
jgi:hypothetical protein